MTNNMQKEGFVSIIIVNWNGASFLSKCLDSIHKNIIQTTYEIIIVDNASEDSSVSILRRYEKKFNKRDITMRIIINKRNEGFAEGNNIGFKYAKGAYILFLNSDTQSSSDFLSPMVRLLDKHRNVGAVQPKIMQTRDKSLIDSAGSYFLNSGFLYHAGHNRKDTEEYNISSYIFSMKGACMLVRKTLIKKIGLFSKNYFAYFEETDLCMRILIAGYGIVYMPQACIYHLGGGTANKIASPFILYHAYKNRIFTYACNFQLRRLLTTLPIHIFLCTLVSFLYIITGKMQEGFSIVKGMAWVAGHIPEIIRNRRKIARYRKVQDDDYLPNITYDVSPSYYYHLFRTSLIGYEDKFKPPSKFNLK